MRKLILTAGLLAFAVGACNTPFNNNALPATLAGPWSGSLTSAGASLGTLHLTMVPRSGGDIGTGTRATVWEVGGDWSMSLPAAADSGTMTGSGADGFAAVKFTLESTGGCSINLDGNLFAGKSIFGRFAASSCALPDTGSFLVEQQ